MSATNRLTGLNVLNVLAYIVNAAVTFGIGVGGIDGLPTNGELSLKYQTLVTPIGSVFAIWGVIFLAQLVFVVVQLLTPYRADPLVVKGVGLNYIGVCVAQVGWTLAFSFEVIWLSLVFMLMILFFLVSLIVAQYKTQEETTVLDYWLFKFPFAIHCGWITAASFVNINLVLVRYSIGATIQYYSAFATVGCVTLIALFALRYPSRSEYVIPLVLSYASLGIYFELSVPKESIVTTFGDQKIDYVKFGAAAASLFILLSVIVTGIQDYLGRKRNQSTGSSNTDSVSADYIRHEDN